MASTRLLLHFTPAPFTTLLCHKKGKVADHESTSNSYTISSIVRHTLFANYVCVLLRCSQASLIHLLTRTLQPFARTAHTLLVSMEQRANVHLPVITDPNNRRPRNLHERPRKIPQRIVRPQRLLRIIRHKPVTSSGNDSMHQHAPQRTVGSRLLVDRTHMFHGNVPLAHDAVSQAVQHFVHQQWYLPAIGEQPQVDDEGKSCGFVVVCYAACVKPGDEMFEDLRILGNERDRVVFCGGPSAAQSSFEIARVECQKALVDVKGTFLVVAPDDYRCLRGAVC